MYVRYMVQESDEESSSSDSSEEPNSDNQPNVRISKSDAFVLEQITKKKYDGDFASTEESDSDTSFTSSSSFSVEKMDGPTLNLLSRFRAQVVSDVKSKMKDDSTSESDTETTENGPKVSDTESDATAQTETESTDSIPELRPDIPGASATEILRRKSMVTSSSIGIESSGLRRRNNIPRRRSDNFGVRFATQILSLIHI